MNRIYRIRSWVGALAILAGVLLAVGATAAPALATLPPPDPGTAGVAPSAVVHTGGMPGWQISLIAIGAALFAAVAAVLADRAWAARRSMTTAKAV